MVNHKVLEFKPGDTISTLRASVYHNKPVYNQISDVVYRNEGAETEVANTDPLVAGGEYELHFAPTPTGTPLSKDPVGELIRSTKLKQLLNEVARNHAVMVRAPPMIGKSVLGRQLLRYEPLFETVRLFDLSHWNPKIDSLEAGCGFKLPKRPVDLLNMPRTLWIFDEAQKLNSYPRSHEFWTMIKAIENQLPPRLHVILLAVYGESSSLQALMTENIVTPGLIHKLDFNIVLFDRLEFDTVINRYNSATAGVKILSKVSDFVFSYLGGHPGLTIALLTSLSDSDSGSLRNKDKRDGTYSTNDILDLIISRLAAKRCTPPLDNRKLTAQSQEILKLLFDKF